MEEWGVDRYGSGHVALPKPVSAVDALVIAAIKGRMSGF
jgi:hypothetical protein